MTAGLTDVTCVGVDADDTLWHSEKRFRAVHDRFRTMLARRVALTADELDAHMLATEQRNLRLFGYGAKGFTLSLIESAIEITQGRIEATEIATIIDFGKELLDHPVELLPGVEESLVRLRDSGRRTILITKGDLWHQESKIAASGVDVHFDDIEIVAEKDEATYASILARHRVDPAEFCMVGNSVRSDILPVLAIGGRAVQVPYDVVWAHEVVDDPTPAFPTVGSLAEFVDLLLTP